MVLEDFDLWPELISIEQFNELLAQLFDKKDVLGSEVVIEVLCVLSQKYVKFYDSNVLTIDQQKTLNEVLIEFTDLSKLDRMEDLTSMLFGFMMDDYYLYLKKHLNTIIVKEVYQEVSDSIKEYESLI